MVKIGLTGGIATGKSLVSGYFQDENIVVLDADAIYKNLLKTNKVLYNEIKKSFNLKEVDFKALGKIVFSDESQLKKLNKITHPYVIKVFSDQLKRLENQEKIVVLDIPLLYEAKMENFCDRIICVYTEYETQISRLQNRNNLTRDEAKKRIDSQESLTEKCKKSDYVIDNSFDTETTFRQFQKIFKEIKEIANVS